MIVSFHTQSMRDCCANLEQAEAFIGPAHAQELLAIIADAEAVSTAAEFIELYGPDAVIDGISISIPIGTGYRVSFIAVGARISERKRSIDWAQVQRLKITDIG